MVSHCLQTQLRRTSRNLTASLMRVTGRAYRFSATGITLAFYHMINGHRLGHRGLRSLLSIAGRIVLISRNAVNVFLGSFFSPLRATHCEGPASLRPREKPSKHLAASTESQRLLPKRRGRRKSRQGSPRLSSTGRLSILSLRTVVYPRTPCGPRSCIALVRLGKPKHVGRKVVSAHSASPALPHVAS
jgi:hypothetical protein